MTKEIYETFEQWANSDFLEVGEPRKKAYSKDELLLVEMGWKYGYDAGRAVEQALDKKAENARELGLDYEPVCHICNGTGEMDSGGTHPWGWAINIPCECTAPPAQPAPVQRCTSCDGTGDVHDQTGEWRGTCHCEAGQAIKAKPPAAQRPWVGLTDEERDDLLDNYITAEGRARAIEAKLKEKNSDR